MQRETAWPARSCQRSAQNHDSIREPEPPIEEGPRDSLKVDETKTRGARQDLHGRWQRGLGPGPAIIFVC